MACFINDTSEYHAGGLDTLGWEMTVQAFLESPDSPGRTVLMENGTFGTLLFTYLNRFHDMSSVKSVLEVGGGYGSLMRDFLRMGKSMSATMVDLSRVLLEEQKKQLFGRNAHFVLKNAMDLGPEFYSAFELAVFNENAGDFPAVCGIDPDDLKNKKNIPELERVRYFFQKYDLAVPNRPFTFNIGIMEIFEKLIRGGVPAIYISEHSCEAKAPEKYSGVWDKESDGFPERISLKGHDEYTVKFSYLKKAAEMEGYRVIYGPYEDFLRLKDDQRLSVILRAGINNDSHEIVRQFVYDLFKYEYIFCLKKKQA